MKIYGVDRAEAITILAIEHGDSDGDVISIDEDLDKGSPNS
ncbi:hypothetical protein HMF8227_02373 [Saliniradius amylolyticus]|uniref:Uncharacterized protein n=2 Tax=Saliniradius amylolyticus TaxID=2183582 RepID=A0A2S2E591_9ALTE|nr:hypothetical protein HMF8227_02373 [Saliniradius amylolyticus]